MQDILGILAVLMYGLATLYFFIKFFFKKERAKSLAFLFLVLAVVMHGADLLVFTLEQHRLPANTLPEAFCLMAWLTTLLFTMIARKDSFESMALVLLPITIISLVTMELYRPHVATNPQALGGLIFVHIPLMILSVAALSLTFVLAILYLLQERQLKTKNPAFFYHRLPSLTVCEDLEFKSLFLGFILLTLGILTGMLWSKTKTGVYWHWDYKEIWSMITWILYAILLQGRLLAAWRGKKAAYLAILGFAFMIFTFAGVSFVYKGYHAF